MKNLKTLSAAMLAATLLPAAAVQAGSGSVTLIQTGDIHGHLLPRYNLRSDAVGSSMEGGVARMYTVIKEMRNDATKCTYVNKKKVCTDYSLLLNTGDTLQGSGEALFSRGQAMIDVLNNFGFVAHAPGNWDFLYGAARFEETFKGTATTKPWPTGMRWVPTCITPTSLTTLPCAALRLPIRRLARSVPSSACCRPI